jgi:hypothetical protein
VTNKRDPSMRITPYTWQEIRDEAKRDPGFYFQLGNQGKTILPSGATTHQGVSGSVEPTTGKGKGAKTGLSLDSVNQMIVNMNLKNCKLL